MRKTIASANQVAFFRRGKFKSELLHMTSRLILGAFILFCVAVSPYRANAQAVLQSVTSFGSGGNSASSY
jgi:hypothetical protein